MYSMSRSDIPNCSKSSLTARKQIRFARLIFWPFWLFLGGQKVGKMWTFSLQGILLSFIRCGKETEKKKVGKNHLMVSFSAVSKLSIICQKGSKIKTVKIAKNNQFLAFKSSYLPCFSKKFKNSFERIKIKGIPINGGFLNLKK